MKKQVLFTLAVAGLIMATGCEWPSWFPCGPKKACCDKDKACKAEAKAEAKTEAKADVKDAAKK